MCNHVNYVYWCNGCVQYTCKMLVMCIQMSWRKSKSVHSILGSFLLKGLIGKLYLLIMHFQVLKAKLTLVKEEKVLGQRRKGGQRGEKGGGEMKDIWESTPVQEYFRNLRDQQEMGFLRSGYSSWNDMQNKKNTNKNWYWHYFWMKI